jgi:lipid A 3-O-deacylase
MKSCSIAMALALTSAVSVDQAGARAADERAAEERASGAGWLSELRVGVFAHDQAPLVDNVESGADLNIELLFKSPRFLRGIGGPRPDIGVTLASEGTSLAYAGLTWEHDFRSRWFLTGSLGLAVHDGDPLREEDQTLEEIETKKALGCRATAHVTAGAGYRFSPRWNVALHYEHLSNATLCDSNEGLENIGVRVGRRF